MSTLLPVESKDFKKFKQMYDRIWLGTTYQNLWNSYYTAMISYLQSVQISQPPLVLRFPSLYFYLKRPTSKAPEIFTIDYFPYGLHKKTNRLLPRTFPSFLKNVCNVPYIKNSYVEPFYSALVALLIETPRNRLQIIIEQIKRSAPAFAVWLTCFESVLISNDLNLYFDMDTLPQQTSYISSTTPRYQSILSLPFDDLPPAKLTMKYFREFLNENRQIPCQEFIPDKGTLTFKSSSFKSNCIYSIKYDSENDYCFSEKYSGYTNTFSLKAVNLDQGSPVIDISQSLLQLFEILCGSHLELINQFAEFFASSMFSSYNDNPQMTVLLTKHHQKTLSFTLAHIFSRVLVHLQWKQHKKSKTPLPSLNQLTKHDAIRQLFIAQCQGAGIVFVRDIPPSDSSVKLVRKLINGKTIRITSNMFPAQHYKNHLHFVCISDDEKNAHLLQKKLKCNLIDFSHFETDLEESFNLSPQDIHWIRSTFTIYGFMRLSRKEFLDPDTITDASQKSISAITVDEELLLFLQKCCTIQDGQSCSVLEIYHGYQKFYNTFHNGKETSLTPKLFNKKLRKILYKTYPDKIKYKRLHPSRNTNPYWGYSGLSVLENFVVEPIHTQENTHSLFSQLHDMNQYSTSFDFPQTLQVSISGGFK